MSTAIAIPRGLRRLVESFGQQAQAVTPERGGGEEEGDPGSLELLLAFSVFVFDQVTSAEEFIRLEAARKQQPFDPDTEQAVEDLYRVWFDATGKLRRTLESAPKDDRLPSAERFLECYREARGILTPDDDFFQGDRLNLLRDKAEEEYRGGLVEPMP
jgi:hypothetical protein